MTIVLVHRVRGHYEDFATGRIHNSPGPGREGADPPGGVPTYDFARI